MVSSAKQRSEREQFWRRLIHEQQRSGASIKALCRSRGVSEPSVAAAPNHAWRPNDRVAAGRLVRRPSTGCSKAGRVG